MSPDSQRVGYGARAGDKWLVVVDGKEGNPYDRILSLVFDFAESLHYLAGKVNGIYDIYLVHETVG